MKFSSYRISVNTPIDDTSEDRHSWSNQKKIRKDEYSDYLSESPERDTQGNSILTVAHVDKYQGSSANTRIDNTSEDRHSWGNHKKIKKEEYSGYLSENPERDTRGNSVLTVAHVDKYQGSGDSFSQQVSEIPLSNPTTVPTIWLGGSNNPSIGMQGTIGYGYAELLSGAFIESGATVFRMWSSAIEYGAMRQVNAGAMTLQEQQENLALLQDIADYCNANGIRIAVEDAFTWGSWWQESWVAVAQQVGLPIAFVESNEELLLQTADTPEDLTALANRLIEGTRIIATAFPNVRFGDIEPPLNFDQAAWNLKLSHWWSIFNSVSEQNNIPGFSYYLGDVGWNSPEIDWRPALASVNSLASDFGLDFGVFLNGYYDNLNSTQWTNQAKQHLVDLATDPNLDIDFLVMETWYAFPNEAAPSASPGSMANLGLSAQILYPILQNGYVTAQSSAAIMMTSPQIILNQNSETYISGISVILASADVANGRVASVLITSRDGRLTATPYLNGQVSGSGTHTIILTGTQDEINSELSSLKIRDNVSGLSSLNIEVYTLTGVTAQETLPLVNLPSGVSGPLITFRSDGTQDWESATATYTNGKLTLATINWHSSEKDASGVYHNMNSYAVYSPIFNQNVIFQDGQFFNPKSQGSAAQVYDGSLYSFRAVGVLSTSYNYDSSTGAMLRETSTIAPDRYSIASDTTTNPFSAGGFVSTMYNTGTNPMWSSKWDSNLASLTTVTIGGRVTEAIQIWKPENPIYQRISSYSPVTGQLWETVDSNSSGSNFVTGTRTVTEFNTGDNPNWNEHFGSATKVSTTYQNLFVISQSVFSPDGSMVTEHWAKTGDAWDYLYEYFNTEGQLTQKNYLWKDESPIRSTTEVYQPTTGRLFQVWEGPDAGGYILTQYDPDSNQTYSSFVQVVDSNNRIVDLRQNWDSGQPYNVTDTRFDSIDPVARQIEIYNATDVNIQILQSNGAIFFSDMVPLSAFVGLEATQRHFVFSGSSGQSISGTAGTDDFVLKTVGSDWTQILLSFDATRDLISLPYKDFGSFSQIQLHTRITPVGAIIDSIDGRFHVTISGVSAGQLTDKNFVTI